MFFASKCFMSTFCGNCLVICQCIFAVIFPYKNNHFSLMMPYANFGWNCAWSSTWFFIKKIKIWNTDRRMDGQMTDIRKDQKLSAKVSYPKNHSYLLQREPKIYLKAMTFPSCHITTSSGPKSGGLNLMLSLICWYVILIHCYFKWVKISPKHIGPFCNP